MSLPALGLNRWLERRNPTSLVGGDSVIFNFTHFMHHHKYHLVQGWQNDGINSVDASQWQKPVYVIFCRHKLA